MANAKFGGRFKQTATQKAKGKAADKAIKQAGAVVAAAGAAMVTTPKKGKDVAAKGRDIYDTTGTSPEWAAAVAIQKGDPSIAPPELRDYVRERIAQDAQEKAAQAEKERLDREAKKAEKAAAKAAKAEAREKAKAEGKPRRFPFFGSVKGGGNE